MYDAIWRVGWVKGQQISARVNLAGIISYQNPVEYPFTMIHTWQSSAVGNIRGDQTIDADCVITSVRVDDESNPYNGEGFSVISYAYQLGAGEGYAYTKTSGEVTRLDGQLIGPLFDRIFGKLDERSSPPSLSLNLERVDIGSAGAVLKVKVWGPQRVSPGQTVDYIIGYRNDGVKVADETVVFTGLDPSVKYLSASAGVVYDEFYHEVAWNLGKILPQSSVYLNVQIEVSWGLP